MGKYQHILHYASFVDHSLDALTANEYRRNDARGVISGLQVGNWVGTLDLNILLGYFNKINTCIYYYV